MAAIDTLHPSLGYHIVNTLGWRSLRPLQEAATAPLLAGEHALLIAPTAGGKTEAAVFPLLSRLLSNDWAPLSVLYVCPLRALLNDLHPRLGRYADLLGRRAGIWHGDIAASAKQALRRHPPDLLLSTPESLEGMLVSSRLDHTGFFGHVRAVVIDEIHAFAGDDRGWHLLALLERIGRISGRELQRVGLSATVGNPEALLGWLAGPCAGGRRVVFDPQAQAPGAAPEVRLDWVGSLSNAARVIAGLHRGEKRLVFCDSRTGTEELAHQLRVLGLAPMVSHSSLGRELRSHAERTFSEATEGVMVATSTLELGIDIGDLDRVLQIDAPGRVASFLQRLGRTGRRPGTRASCLFLATRPQAFLRALGVVQLWSEGQVEPVTPPPEPFHVLVQQLMALCLQESGVATADWPGWLLRMPGFAALDRCEVDGLLTFLLRRGLLWSEGGRLWLGTESERRFGRRNFLELLSTITDSPLFTVLHGRQEIGQVDRASFLVAQAELPVLLLGGRTWRVEHVDWQRRRCWVREVDDAGRSRWPGGSLPLSFQLCQAIRRVLRGDATPPGLTRRAQAMLGEMRDDFAWLQGSEARTVFEPASETEERWWTFAGLLGNATLLACLDGEVSTAEVRYDNLSMLLPRAAASRLRELLARGELEVPDSAAPEIDRDALAALKLADCLPAHVAQGIIAARWADRPAARAVLGPAALVSQPPPELRPSRG